VAFLAKNMAELRDLFDCNHHFLSKTIEAGQSIPDGCYINVVLIFIQNSRGEFLIQRRAESTAFGGMYATTGGHPKSGQTSLEGAVTEIEEELGIKVNPDDLRLICARRIDAENVFSDIYYLKLDIELDKLKLQAEEVESVYWFTLYRIREEYREGHFVPAHYEELTNALRYGVIDVSKVAKY